MVTCACTNWYVGRLTSSVHVAGAGTGAGGVVVCVCVKN